MRDSYSTLSSVELGFRRPNKIVVTGLQAFRFQTPMATKVSKDGEAIFLGTFLLDSTYIRTVVH